MKREHPQWLLDYWKARGYDHVPKGKIYHTSGVVQEMIKRGVKMDVMGIKLGNQNDINDKR